MDTTQIAASTHSAKLPLSAPKQGKQPDTGNHEHSRLGNRRDDERHVQRRARATISNGVKYEVYGVLVFESTSRIEWAGLEKLR